MGINFNAHGSDEKSANTYHRRRYVLGLTWACTGIGVNCPFTFVKGVCISWQSWITDTFKELGVGDGNYVKNGFYRNRVLEHIIASDRTQWQGVVKKTTKFREH